jgi:hypothetical protein
VIGIQIRKCFEKLLQIFFFPFGLFGTLWISSTPKTGLSDNKMRLRCFPVLSLIECLDTLL